MATGGSEPSTTNDQEEYFDWVCIKCNESYKITEATFFCTTCNEAFCDICLKDHNRFLKNHIVLGHTEKSGWGKSTHLPTSELECSEHSGQIITLYCQRHDVVCCPMCALWKHSDECKPSVSSVSEIAKKKNQSTVDNVIKETDRLLSDFQNFRNELDKLQSGSQSSKDMCITDVEDFAHTLVSHIEQLKQVAVVKVNTLHNDRANELKVEKDKCAESIRALQEMKMKLQTTDHTDEIMVFVRAKESQKRLQEVEDQSKKRGRKREIRFSFKGNPVAVQLEETMQSLGTYENTDQQLTVEDVPYENTRKYKVACHDVDTVQKAIVHMEVIPNVVEKEVSVVISESKDVLTVLAPTLNQIYLTLENIKKMQSVQAKKEQLREIRTIGASNETLENVDGSNGSMFVDSFSLSEIKWDILCMAELEYFKQLQVARVISYCNGTVKYSSDRQSQAWNRFKAAGSDLTKKHIEEISIENTSVSEVERYTKEICMEFGSKCCIYMEKKKSVVALCDSCEELIHLKHLLLIKQGKIKTSRRRARPLAVENLKSRGKSTEDRGEEGKDAGERRFSWDVHAQHLREFKTEEGIIVKVYKANILNVPVDCIVSASNSTLQHGGGVAKVIADAAGSTLVEDGDNQVRIKGPIPVGFTYTTTAGRLRYECVIHAVGPSWFDYQPHGLEGVLGCEDGLCNAVRNSFNEAEKRNLSSIALPAISAALFGVPEEICAYQYALATVKYSKRAANSPTALKEIHFIDINHNIIKKIQYMFQRVLNDDSRPYNIYKYVRASSTTAK